ncbi:amine oxidase [Nostoc sp. 3335mG]|nr:amine oxidase [Nostoc sp. 3335mG]
MSDWDFVIVGGGAAGVAAAWRVADAGRSVLIVEASTRLGGRAHTVVRSGLPLDLGCGWLHSAQHNPWARIAEQAGFAIDRDLPRWMDQWRDLGFSREDQREASRAFKAFEQKMREEAPPSDRAGDLIDPADKWSPYLETLSGVINGAGLDRLSVADYLAYMDAATDTDWRVVDGYGTLVASHAAGLPVAMGTCVTSIDTDGTRLSIETSRGRLTAGQAIITVSTNILASGAITLPPVFADVQHAASRLPLGDADKLFFEVETPDDLPSDGHLMGNPHAAITGSYTLRPFGRPVIECMVGGEAARTLCSAGFQEAAEFAIGELAELLGSDWRRRLKLVAASAWARHSFVQGAYSHALPGCHAARRQLSMPVDPRIRMAGEACHNTDFSTAHGAYETGISAAESALEDIDA